MSQPLSNASSAQSEVMSIRLSPARDVLAQRVGDEIVLVHLQSNDVYELSSTASRFWELLGEGLTLTDIQKALMDEYNVSSEVLEDEIMNIVKMLRDENLIKNV